MLTNGIVASLPATVTCFREIAKKYGELVLEGAVWCAVDANQDYCAMAYWAEDQDALEIGGVMVATSKLGTGIGSTVMRLVLGTVLTELNPLYSGQRVIAHVHAENDKPRPLIQQALCFAHVCKVSIPGYKLPGLKTDAKGFVNGDEFELSIPNTLQSLADWCDCWPGKLKDETPARIELPHGLSLSNWATDFREMIALHQSHG